MYNLDPITREEEFLAKMAGRDVETPEPITRLEQFYDDAAKGGGSSVSVEPLTVTQNGTTTAPSGKAYSPVTVDVPNPNYVETITGTLGDIFNGRAAEYNQFLPDANFSDTAFMPGDITVVVTFSGLLVGGSLRAGLIYLSLQNDSIDSSIGCADNNSCIQARYRNSSGGLRSLYIGDEDVTDFEDTPCITTIIHHPLPDSE